MNCCISIWWATITFPVVYGMVTDPWPDTHSHDPNQTATLWSNFWQPFV